MKGPSRKDDPPKAKSSKLPKSGSPLATFDEAKASCKARKRKERQESISSLLCQDRKVIRSNSEERPTQKKPFDNKSSIRRVSSSEDFRKSSTTLPDRAEPYDEDYERRRSHERFSKPLAPKSKKAHRSRRPKVRCLSRPKFRPEAPAEEEPQRERSPSPARHFDLKTLHEQVDCLEPLLSCANHQIDEDTETLPGLSVASNRLLSSPRNSIIATHRIYLDPDVPQAFGMDNKTQNPLELRLVKVTKQINGIKKKIKKFEAEFETKYGYKVSHADKLNDKMMRKLYIDLGRMKKEQKQLSDVCPLEESPQNKSQRVIQDTITEIQRRLTLKRDASGRTLLMEKMSSEELVEEKIAVQKALLYLESIHGRPDNKEDRDLARPIYDRYRNLKRMIGKVQVGAPGNELPTIHEDETMNFSASTTPQAGELDSERSVLTSTDSSDTDTSISEKLHSLTKEELLEQHRVTTEEKKELRRTIKLFEGEVQKKTGRMMQKEDRAPIEHVYLAYKKLRAKLKLLDALVGKQL